tara:strand:+ start:10322 stop:10726 length:405 start_codon:yes stop_codon:yes gene_type:complete
MISTLKATFSVMKIAQREFPDVHGQHNKANAFRHALWNIFIANKCKRFSKNNSQIIDWTKGFTDWHEEFSPNEEIAKSMDLHNNLIGRQLFIEHKNLDINQWIEVVKSKLINAELITSIEAIENYPNQLVYLEN